MRKSLLVILIFLFFYNCISQKKDKKLPTEHQKSKSAKRNDSIKQVEDMEFQGRKYHLETPPVRKNDVILKEIK